MGAFHLQIPIISLYIPKISRCQEHLWNIPAALRRRGGQGVISRARKVGAFQEGEKPRPTAAGSEFTNSNIVTTTETVQGRPEAFESDREAAEIRQGLYLGPYLSRFDVVTRLDRPAFYIPTCRE